MENVRQDWRSQITTGEHAGLYADGKTKAKARANLKAKLKRRKQKEMQFTERELSGIIRMYECCIGAIVEEEQEDSFREGDWNIYNREQLDQLNKKLWWHYRNAQKRVK